jgi:hypothetical protein
MNQKTPMKINAKDHIKFLVENIEKFSSEKQPLWHPLGFASCVLGTSDLGVKFRVHYWPPYERRTKNPDWPIHTHSYDLSSLVLQGQIEDIQYEVSEEGEDFLYAVSYSGEDSEIKKTSRRVRVISQSSFERISGDQYSVDRGVFHQSKVKFDKEAITFVALSNWSNEAPLVLGENGDQKYPYERIDFDRELFWSIIRKSLEIKDRSR